MATLQKSVTINRPIEEVFAFVADIRNNVKWQAGVIAAEVLSEGPVGVGTKYKLDMEVMGRKLETTGELIAYDPPKKYGWKATSGPFPVSGSTTLETVLRGTLVVDTIEAKPRGFFKIVEPLLVRRQQRQLEADMAKLEGLLDRGV